jgi:hypothetical protein
MNLRTVMKPGQGNLRKRHAASRSELLNLRN